MTGRISCLFSRLLVSLAAVFAFTACGNSSAQADSQLIRHIIETRFASQEGEITVHLPEGYESDTSKTYPVLYIPAGQNLNSKPVRRALGQLVAAGEAPEAIVVTSNAYYRALPPNDGAESNGAAPEYLAHLQDELIPFIEEKYRTSPERWITGFSSTGIFLLYAMVEAPELFDGYIFQSPAFDDDWVDYASDISRQRLAMEPAEPISVFMGIGSRDTRNERQSGFTAITALFESTALDHIHFEKRTYARKSHEEFGDLIRDGILHLSRPIIGAP